MLKTGPLNELSDEIFSNNFQAGWWSPAEFKIRYSENGKYTKEAATLIGCKLALVHSEVSEALEGMRKGLNDDHLPHRPMIEVELADAVIRILDLVGYLKLDIDGALREKLEYNKQRADHKISNREAAGGKTI